MSIATVTIWVSFIVIIALCAGGIVLQLFLSKKESRWFGLILPIITFLFSLLTPLNIAATPDGATFTFIMQMLFAFLFANIPTFVLLGIYLSCREKIRYKKQLDKMNIQDL